MEREAEVPPHIPKQHIKVSRHAKRSGSIWGHILPEACLQWLLKRMCSVSVATDVMDKQQRGREKELSG